jgi:hypothetical protein
MGNNVSVMKEKLYKVPIERTTEKNVCIAGFLWLLPQMFLTKSPLSLAEIAPSVLMLYIDREKDIYIAL